MGGNLAGELWENMWELLGCEIEMIDFKWDNWKKWDLWLCSRGIKRGKPTFSLEGWLQECKVRRGRLGFCWEFYKFPSTYSTNFSIYI